MRKGAVLAALVAAAALPATGHAQTGTVTGTVVDQSSGQPIPTAQVYLQGTSRNAITSATGTFTLTGVPAGTYQIVAQRIGYQQLTQNGVVVGATGATSVTLRMSTAALSLEAIVATGLVDPVEGVRSPISVARVSSENMPVAAAGGAVQNIQGRVAGVQMNRASGQPGEGTSVVLRTTTSLFGGGAPLIVVDGVILSAPDGGNGRSSGSSTSAIEGLDIESMEVIRGAAAASMYGSRAAAGVISITTKRGSQLQQGQTQFSLHTEVGVTEPFNLEMATHQPWAINANGGWLNKFGAEVPLNTPATSTSNNGAIERGYPLRGVDQLVANGALPTSVIAGNSIANSATSLQFYDQPFPGTIYNNLDNITRAGLYQSHNFTIAQNTLETNFNVSLSRTKETGVVIDNEGYYRNSVRMNLDHRFRETMSLSMSMSHAREGRDEDYGDAIFTNALLAPRYINVAAKDENGEFAQYPLSGISTQSALWSQHVRQSDMLRNQTLISGQYSWNPFRWLTANSTVSYNRGEQHTSQYRPKGTTLIDNAAPNYDGYLNFDDNGNDTFNADAQLSLRRDFGPLNARLTGRTLVERDFRNQSSRTGEGLTVPGVPNFGAVARANEQVTSSETEIRASGYLVDLGLDYGGKYTLTALGRRDGSSLFGVNERWQSYYRTAAAWRMGQEKWFNVPHVSEFKLSFARGTAGGRPNFNAQYQTLNLNTDGVPSLGQMGNPNLKPSKTTENEVSLNSILFKKVGLTLTHAWQRTVDQIVPGAKVLPNWDGFSGMVVNAGSVRGHTTELQLEGNIIQNPNVGWNSLVTADRSASMIDSWTIPCMTENYRLTCQGEKTYSTWGNYVMTSKADLADHVGGSAEALANEFEVNDDGYLVWVGDKHWNEGMIDGKIQPGTWGTTKSIGGQVYQWGLPINQADENGNAWRKDLGDALPMNIGWTNTLRYHNWNFSAQLHASLGAVANNRQLLEMTTSPTGANERNNILIDQFGKADGLKKPYAYYAVMGSGGTSMIVESGSYLKMRTLSAGYRFNRAQFEQWGLKGLGISSAQIGLTGRNVFTITGYRGFDPEQATDLNTRESSVGVARYPSTRTWTVDATLTF
ncbi:MAG: SusC/RagA family TonB-linked outer membrane protein [Gemmatimonadota bacterium]|nr:SusC/RagA family TonB-linked outer membrane protein [Gemmatimonadota bacterium]